jgi:peptide/nickel transport system ATP-binding protein
LNGRNIIDIDEEKKRQLRGLQVAMVFQDAIMTLNPVLRIDTQMIEALRSHKKISRKNALIKAENMLEQLGISAAQKRLKSYPHELSGGMRQRVAIAIAMLNEPNFIIADEPTTALDVTIQAQILYETQELCRRKGTGLIWITHDLTVIAGLADEVCVMYAGKIVEHGVVDDVLDNPLHPYTSGLIGSVPSHNRRGRRLSQIPGMRPSLIDLPTGCAFRERCSRADEKCQKDPEMIQLVPAHRVRCFHPLFE